MKNYAIKNRENGNYKVGLDREQEAVISAHFMHSINQNFDLVPYDEKTFSEKLLPISSKLIFEKLIPAILDASDKFIAERIEAAKIRTKENFKLYGLDSSDGVGLSETIVEVMLDRQFLKGSKTNYPRTTLHKQIQKMVEAESPIKMVIPALPYKSSSPLKTRGTLPDLSEISFLLGLSEITKTIDYIYREKKPNIKGVCAKFTVVCDGSRFNKFLNEPNETVEHYQYHLKKWIKKLGIESFIEIVDYQSIISNTLPTELKYKKNLIRKKVIKEYNLIFLPLLDPNNMKKSLNKAIELEPDPERSNIEGRFVPLFKSLIYIIKYKILTKYAEIYNKDYKKLYQDLTGHLFEPYVELTNKDFDKISNFIFNTDIIGNVTEKQLFEYLRRSMLQEVWRATIAYMAEIKSDRDLCQEPILTCLPNYIRWTIHAKLGQLAILTTTASGDPVQAWHGVGVFKLSKNNKIKLYTLPIIFLENLGATPVTVICEEETEVSMQEFMVNNQPLFYIYPNIKFRDIGDLIDKIKNNLTRKRKF